MTSKEYLCQAYWLEQSIRSRLERIESLTAFAEKCTGVLSDMPKNSTRSVKNMEETITKIADMRDEVSADATRLVDLQAEISQVIQSVDKMQYQVLLSKRYLSFMKWEAIAEDMNYGLRYIQVLHGRALEEVDKVRSRA